MKKMRLLAMALLLATAGSVSADCDVKKDTQAIMDCIVNEGASASYSDTDGFTASSEENESKAQKTEEKPKAQIATK
jgi:hypothetical protein